MRVRPTIYTQLWLQSVLNLTAIGAGLVLLPMAGIAFVVAAAAGRFMHGMAPRFPLGVGLLLIGAGALLRVTMTAQSGWTVLIPGLAVTGVGSGSPPRYWCPPRSPPCPGRGPAWPAAP